MEPKGFLIIKGNIINKIGKDKLNNAKVIADF